jgi:phosphoribosyl 1,2-cyclic phosphodiesterase
MLVRFFGVRGSVPVSDANTWQHGGNTACVEVETPAGYRIILDAGTGIRVLGRTARWGADAGPHQACCLLSHYHWDHIQGLPFFAPLYDPRNRFEFFGPAIHGEADMRSALYGQMLAPYFPVGPSALGAIQDFAAVESGRRWTFHDVTIEAAQLHHPQGCLGFRIESERGVAVYASDNEPGDRRGDDAIRHLAREADVLICDAQYSPAVLERRRGWGHSSWPEAVGVAQAARARCLLLFHHDPDADDAAIRRTVQLARERFPETWGAAEGLAVQCVAPSVKICPTAPRNGPRLDMRIPVRLRVRREDGSSMDMEGCVNNLTLQGTYAVVPEALEMGTEVEMCWMEGRPTERPLRGTVVRVDEHRRDGSPGIGIAFQVEERVREISKG